MPHVLFACVLPPSPASEAIAAGVLMGTTQMCLVHAKIAAGQVLLSVRTKDAGYSNLVAQMCRAVLA